MRMNKDIIRHKILQVLYDNYNEVLENTETMK